MGTQLPLPKGAQPPISGPLRCGQTAGWTKIPLGVEAGLSPGDFVLDGDPATPEKKGTAPPHPFSAHAYCGQTAGWIKMPLGTKVDICTGHIVLDGDQAPHAKTAQQPPPLFSAHVYCGQGRPSQLLLSSCWC